MTPESHSAARGALLLGQDVQGCCFAVTHVPLLAGTSLYISRTTLQSQNLVTQRMHYKHRECSHPKKLQTKRNKGQGEPTEKKSYPGFKDNKGQYKMKSSSNPELKWRTKKVTDLGLEASQKLSCDTGLTWIMHKL